MSSLAAVLHTSAWHSWLSETAAETAQSQPVTPGCHHQAVPVCWQSRADCTQHAPPCCVCCMPAVTERDLQSLQHPNLSVLQAVVTSIDTHNRVSSRPSHAAALYCIHTQTACLWGLSTMLHHCVLLWRSYGF